MSDRAGALLEHLEELAGSRGKIRVLSDEGVSPALSVVTWADLPEPGHTTSCTIGLSFVDFAEWTESRPELFISVASSDPAWGLAVGRTALRYRGEYGFCVGQPVEFGRPISEASDMTAFLPFWPVTLPADLARLTLTDGSKVSLIEMIPLYQGELEMIRRGGFGSFMNANPDIYDVRRPDLSRRPGAF
ncbi:MAG TPA: suppressor of fused domain protein [Vicinamibacteria bacterium]|nr:suppressor of fused domain protein [Vicinamibacteria bacterium]